MPFKCCVINRERAETTTENRTKQANGFFDICRIFSFLVSVKFEIKAIFPNQAVTNRDF